MVPLIERLQLLAVGDHLGTLHVVEIPWSYKKDATNEVSGSQGISGQYLIAPCVHEFVGFCM